MASKKETLELVVGLIEGNVTDEVMAQVVEALKPKAGGKANVGDYTAYAEDGTTITDVFCTIHKKWEPVENDEGEANFREDAKSKNGLQRYCIEGAKQWTAAAKAHKASKDGIMADLLEGEIDNIQAKELLDIADAERKEPFAREDGVGEDEKPGVDTDEAEEEA